MKEAPLVELPAFLRLALKDMTQAEFAMRMGRPKKTINEILKGKARATWRFAIECERVLGIDGSAMMKLQYDEDLYRARLRAQNLHIMEESLEPS